nr:hypothetical protein [Microctonus hyperodae filamentous virus]
MYRRRRQGFFLLLILVCNVTNAVVRRTQQIPLTLTPSTDGSSYSTENKRNLDEIVARLAQLQILVIDEVRRVQSEIVASDQTLKTEIGIDKAETANNLKRHSGIIVSHVNAVAQYLQEVLPQLKKMIVMHAENTNKMYTKQDSLVKNILLILEAFEKWRDDFSDIATSKFALLLELLRKIEKNTDLDSTDTNSIGNQINDLTIVVGSIADAIGVIDKRLPAIDMNGDGLLRNLQNNFDALNAKLEGFTKLSPSITSITKRLEDVLLKLGENSYPRNDNHMPNTGNIPPVYMQHTGGDDFVPPIVLEKEL